MATTATAPRPTVKEYTFQWVGLDRNQREVRGEVEGRVRNRRHDQPAAAGNPCHQDQAADAARRAQHHAEGHHLLHPPARDDAEGRRADAAVVRHRGARPQQRAVLAAHDADQRQDRVRIEPVAGVPRAPARISTTCTATSSTPARRRARSTRSSTASRSTSRRSSRSRARSRPPCSTRSRCWWWPWSWSG